MAPITRSARPVPASPDRDQSQLLDDDEEMADTYDEQSLVEDRQSPFQSSAQDILRPLQDTANRVSKQVEEFAKALDKFVAHQGSTGETLWHDVLVLLDRYVKIVESRRARTPTDESAAHLHKIDLEADLWTLLKSLLSCGSPDTLHNAQIAQASRLGGLHRYSSNVELWTAFLDSDPVAQEYECLLGWLQDRARQTSPPIEEVLRPLAEKSERGEGVWSAGPMYTQTAIKHQKRTRLWSMPLEPSNPGLDRTHIRPSDRKPLVAQLDPDARTRESAALQDQDEYHEQVAWRTCWEMLRRGYAAPDIRSWWDERKEVWRYDVLRACGPQLGHMATSPWLRILNLASAGQWLKRCEALARNPAVADPHQRSVYGVLCGDLESSKAAATSIDDHLFHLFNALLIQRYQHYFTVYRAHLASSTPLAFHPEPPSTSQIRQYAALAQRDAATKLEAQGPHKLFELAVVSQDFGAFLVAMGQAATHVAHATGQGANLMEPHDSEHNEIAQVNARDQDALRMVVHLQLILQSLGMLDDAYARHTYELENNIASYIGWLAREGKFSLLPLYASKLSADRTQHVLGAILVDVTDSRERELLVKLMRQYGIDVSEIAYGIFSLANFREIRRVRDMTAPPTPPRITESVGAAPFAQLKVRPGLMTGELSAADEKAIRSVEWYRYVGADHWGSAAWSVALLYKWFLFHGRFAALRRLSERVSLTDVSLAAVQMNLNFSDEEPPDPKAAPGGTEADDGPLDGRGTDRERRDVSVEHPLTRAGTDRATLAFKSLIWKQLEQLAVAIDTLDAFQEVADNLETTRSNPSLLRAHKRDLKKALDDVRHAMLPLLDNDFLRQPQDEMEGVLLDHLRRHYIPECILAYNSVLWCAGHYVSRAWLVECMELAQVVARVPMLTNAFVEGGRMKDLVRAFAVDSKALLEAAEHGTGKSRNLKSEKGNANIWKLRWKDNDPLDLEGLD